MKTRIRNTVLCAVAALALCACSNDDAPESAARIPLTVKATIAGMNTRAVTYAEDGTGSFAEGDIIYVTKLDSDDKEYDSYKSVPYVYDGSEFVPQDDDYIIYFEPGSSESFKLKATYTPFTYTEVTDTDNSVTCNQTAGLPDELTAQTEICTARNPEITFQFHHARSKYTLTFSSAVSQCKIVLVLDSYGTPTYTCIGYLSNDGKTAEIMVPVIDWIFRSKLEVTTTDGVVYKADLLAEGAYNSEFHYILSVNLHEGLTIDTNGTFIVGDYSDETSGTFTGEEVASSSTM